MSTVAKAAQYAVALGFCLMTAELPAPSQVLVPIKTNIRVSRIIAVGDEMWLGSSEGAFRVDRKGAHAVSVDGHIDNVYSIVPIGDEVWLGSSQGAFRVDRKRNQAMPLEVKTFGVSSIALFSDEVWLGSTEGTFRVDRKTNQIVRVESDAGSVYSLTPFGGELWLGGEKGAFRVDQQGNRAVRMEGDAGRVYSLTPVGAELWLGSENGAFRVDRRGNRVVRVEGDTGQVDSIVSAGDELWLGSEKGAFRVDRKGNRAVRVEGVSGRVYAIVAIGDEIWLGSWEGAFRVEGKGNQAVPLEVDTYGVNSIVPIGNEVWLGSAQGAFRVDRKSHRGVRVEGNTGSVYFIIPVADEIWLGSMEGAFLVNPHTKISVDFDRALPGSKRLLGMPVWLEGIYHPIVRYIDTETGRENYSTSQAAPIKLIHDSDSKKLLGKEEDQGNWTNVGETLIELRPGWQAVHIAVQDAWGNKQRDQTVEGWVVPRWTLSALIPLISISFCLMCLALAPYIRYCHMLLMNPFLRNWASFGILPLLVTAVPPLRRHILRRYCRNLALEPRLQSFAELYVVPDKHFTSSGFAGALLEHKVIGLHGQSGIGKSAFLSYLTYQCTSRKTMNPLLRCVVPVILDLSVSFGATPGEMVQTVLRKYGDLTDNKLTEVMLDYGGFLFLFDGLSEVSEASSIAILGFADMHRNHSFSCLTTQVATEELTKASRLIEAIPLSDENIRELVRRLAQDSKTGRQKFDPESLLEKFTEEIYKTCRVPLQLELVVEMWEKSGLLPENLDGVYSYVLGPLLDKAAWSDRGHGEWPDVLSALAFTMMTEKRPYNAEKDYLPDELRVELLTKKLLVERGGLLEFRHDRIRAYLAAKYFALQWRRILTDEKVIVDPNWDTMLEFHLAVENNKDQARDLVFLVLNKDMESAIRLTSWVQQNHSELLHGWQKEFAGEIGSRVLHGSTSRFRSLN